MGSCGALTFGEGAGQHLCEVGDDVNAQHARHRWIKVSKGEYVAIGIVQLDTEATARCYAGAD